MAGDPHALTDEAVELDYITDAIEGWYGIRDPENDESAKAAWAYYDALLARAEAAEREKAMLREERDSNGDLLSKALLRVLELERAVAAAREEGQERLKRIRQAIHHLGQEAGALRQEADTHGGSRTKDGRWFLGRSYGMEEARRAIEALLPLEIEGSALRSPTPEETNHGDE